MVYCHNYISLLSPSLLSSPPSCTSRGFCHARGFFSNCVSNFSGVNTFRFSYDDMVLNKIVQQIISRIEFAEFRVNPRIWQSARSTSHEYVASRFNELTSSTTIGHLPMNVPLPSLSWNVEWFHSPDITECPVNIAPPFPKALTMYTTGD